MKITFDLLSGLAAAYFAGFGYFCGVNKRPEGLTIIDAFIAAFWPLLVLWNIFKLITKKE